MEAVDAQGHSPRHEIESADRFLCARLQTLLRKLRRDVGSRINVGQSVMFLRGSPLVIAVGLGKTMRTAELESRKHRLDGEPPRDETSSMTAKTERIRTQILALSEQDRADLAHWLIRSLDKGTDPDTESAWDTELERRRQEIKSGKAIGEPAEKVFAELRDKHT